MVPAFAAGICREAMAAASEQLRAGPLLASPSSSRLASPLFFCAPPMDSQQARPAARGASRDGGATSPAPAAPTCRWGFSAHHLLLCVLPAVVPPGWCRLNILLRCSACHIHPTFGMQVWRYFLQLAAGLQYLHHSRVLHRDVKPEASLPACGAPAGHAMHSAAQCSAGGGVAWCRVVLLRPGGPASQPA